MAMHTQPCFPPPKSDSNFLALAMHSLWIPIRDEKVGLPWARISGLCVNDSHILSTAGADTTTMMGIHKECIANAIEFESNFGGG